MGSASALWLFGAGFLVGLGWYSAREIVEFVSAMVFATEDDSND